MKIDPWLGLQASFIEMECTAWRWFW